MAVSLAVFSALLAWVLRRRATRPAARSVAWVAAVVVVAGMLFARYAANRGITPAIYYGVPAVLTFVLPPLVFRMHRRETSEYVLLAMASSPAIHMVFSLVIGWHEYLPFWYVPSIAELLRGGG